MLVRVYQEGFQAGLKGEWWFDNTSSQKSVTVYCMEQSDRCPSYPVEDDRAWAYRVGMEATITFTPSFTNTNSMSVQVNTFSSWRVKRSQGSTPGGLACVRGNYSWYSTINGAEIYHYIGPSTSGQGDASWGSSGGSISYNTGNVPAQNESGRQQFGRFYNHVNGLQSSVYLVFFNDLPPDYRPGERKINGGWWSTNRNGGWCERKSGGWYEMRTIGGGSSEGDPPERKINGTWKNQSKTGGE